MRRDLVYRDEIMNSLVKEYNCKRTNDGLKLAWIEKAVNDVKPAQIDLPDKNVGEKIFGQIDIEALRAALLAWSYMPEWRDNKIIEAVKQAQQIQINNNVGELISRQAAIEALNREYRCGAVIDHCGLETAMDIISELPPAPSEIIHCKDCGHRDDHGCCKYWRGLAMGETPIATDDYDFCNHARRREREH